MPNPDERQSLFTDFKDPFDLLTDLHTTRLRMVYENTFARGNRSDMNTGYRERPSSSVGNVSSPNYRLPVDAPMTEWQARTGSGGVLPTPSPINYSRDYGDPGIDRGEWKRFGSALKPIGAAAQKLGEDFYERRKKAKYQPLIDRLESINQEMGETKNQMEDVRLNLSETRMEERNRRQDLNAEKTRKNAQTRQEKQEQREQLQKEKQEQREKKASAVPAPPGASKVLPPPYPFIPNPPTSSPSPGSTPPAGLPPLSTIDKTREKAKTQYNRGGNTEVLQVSTAPAGGLQPIPEHLENRASSAREKARESKGTDLPTTEPDTPLVTPEEPPSPSSPRRRPTSKPSMSAPSSPPVVKEKGQTTKNRRPALKQTPWK